MSPYIVIGILLLGLATWIFADDIFWPRRWRKCLRCQHWFSDCGDIIAELPAGTPEKRIDGAGVCSDCSKDVEFNRQ